MKVGVERLDYTSMQNKNHWKYTVRATAGTDRRSTRGHPKMLSGGPPSQLRSTGPVSGPRGRQASCHPLPRDGSHVFAPGAEKFARRVQGRAGTGNTLNGSNCSGSVRINFLDVRACDRETGRDRTLYCSKLVEAQPAGRVETSLRVTPGRDVNSGL